MTKPPRVLCLESGVDDSAEVRSVLAAESLVTKIVQVQNREEFVAALKGGGIDLIVADFSVSGFDGLTVAAEVSAHWPGLPLILVSELSDQKLVIDSLRSGATDYVLKTHLSRLAPAVARAMQEVEARREKRKLEAQFFQSQKMEVVGVLAAGVAHDFNNILMIIGGYNGFISADAGPSVSIRKHTEQIQVALDRAVGLTRQLLVFSRKQAVHPEVIDLNEQLAGMDKMLRQLIGENIEIVLLPSRQASWVFADAGYVGQVLMNLVVNARDALPDGGRITIKLTDVTLGAEQLASHAGVVPGDFVRIDVSDTGTGMTEEVKAHLFEAFFTTKPLGKGTGLGLATCNSIAQQSGGFIEVQSELGHGSTMKVYLPRVNPPKEPAAHPGQAEVLPQGRETVLVAEDEPEVRRMACSILEARGYLVLSGRNGKEALQAALTHKGEPVRLVLTDVIMPVMGGREMVEKLKESYPKVLVLYSSGYTDGTAQPQALRTPGVDYLPKPYTAAKLSRKVRSMLDDKGGRPSSTASTENIAAPPPGGGPPSAVAPAQA